MKTSAYVQGIRYLVTVLWYTMKYRLSSGDVSLYTPTLVTIQSFSITFFLIRDEAQFLLGAIQAHIAHIAHI